MFIYEHKIRVRYAETDKMGYVYYGNYATFYEVARTEMLRSTGISYKDLEDQGIMLPVIDLNSQFHKPAHYDDLITVKTYIREKPTVRIRFDYEVYHENGDLLNTGATQLVFVEMARNRPCKPPHFFIERMAKYFDE